VIQTDDTIFDSVASREQNYWCSIAGLAKAGQDLQSVAPRQHPVEDQCVERLPGEAGLRLIAGRRRHNGVALGLEAALQASQKLALIIHHEYLRQGISTGDYCACIVDRTQQSD
jgi:hypothetical protein